MNKSKKILNKKEIERFMKIQVLQNRMVITSTLKVDQIKELLANNRAALAISDEEGNEIFSVAYSEVGGSANKYGISFNTVGENGEAVLAVQFIIKDRATIKEDLAKQFRENHVPFVVVDANPQLGELAAKHKYPYYIIAEPHTQTAMLKSHLSSAKGLISLSDNIADNIAMVTSARLFEKELGRVPYFIMTSANSDGEAEKLIKLGANSIVSATKLVAQRLNAISARPDMENMLEKFVYDKNTALDIEEIKVPDYSWLRFKRIKETHLRTIVNTDIVGLRDQNNKFLPMPNGDTLIGTGSRLLVIGTAESIRAAKRLIYSKHKPEEYRYV